MENVIFSFKKEFRETTLRSFCDVIDDVILWKYLFLHNLGQSSHFWCQFEAAFNILTFSKWPPFWARNEIFTGSDTGSWIFYEDSHKHLWHFELLIDALAQILTELLQFKVLTYFWDPMTSSMKQSTIVCKGIFTIQWYICTLSLKMIYFVLQLSWKMVFFHSKRNLEKRLWGRSVTSSMTSSYENIYSCIIWDDLFISDVNLKLCLIFWHFQNGRHIELATKFLPEVTLEAEYSTRIAISICDILSFWSML